jgi:tetratricopeptide (TPR) repeat protein
LIRYGITGGFKINVSDMRRKILALDPPPEHDYFPLFIESLVFLGEFGGIPEIVAKYKPLPNSIPPFKKAFIWHYAAAAALKQGDSRTARRYWGYAVRADDGFERAARILDEWDESSYREEHPGFFEITEILPRCVIRGINAAYREKSKFRSGDSVQSLYRRFPYVSKFILPLLTFGDRHARDFAIMLDAFLSRSGEGRSHLQKISFQPTEKLPSAIAPHFEKGYALLMEKDKEAESVFREAIALDPNIPNLWQNLAAALEQQGKKEESEAVINKIFEKFPDYSFGRINMAVRAALKGDVPGARKFLEPLMEKDVLHVSEYTGVCQASFFICRAEDDDTGMKAWLDCWKKAAPDDVRIEEFELEIRLKNMLNSPDSFFSVEKRNGEKENQKY